MPAAGVCERVKTALQLSAATTTVAKSGTNAWQSAPTGTVWFTGQATLGGVVSFTVILTVSSSLAPLVSVTASVNVCVPRGRVTFRMAEVPSTVSPLRH